MLIFPVYLVFLGGDLRKLEPYLMSRYVIYLRNTCSADHGQ